MALVKEVVGKKRQPWYVFLVWDVASLQSVKLERLLFLVFNAFQGMNLPDKIVWYI